MNLNRLIPSKPSQLGKYPDQAVLTAPVTISVGVPTESVSFWQSYGFFIVVIVWSVMYVFMAVWELSTGYTVTTIDEILRNILGLWSLLAIPMLFLFLMIYWLHRTQKGFVVPNPWIARKWTWKHVPIMVIKEDSISFLSSFFIFIDKLHHDQIVSFDDVEKFYLNQSSHSGIGFSIIYKKQHVAAMKNKDKRLEGLLAHKKFTLYEHYNVLNGRYYIDLREILNIMNTFHKQRTDGIKYLSQDNHDNLMDIGW
ncbi:MULTISPECIES: hypothetical protein [Psychrobacter]|nr:MULTISPECIES: hypothetical protein [Psychrobacter]TEW81814.1 hypothetical protein E2545_12315 [Psychrobacter sp. 230]|tara:strand:+ start:44 stop:805 length:762 start_codon:yes stop_codon:yes gene_type:complete